MVRLFEDLVRHEGLRLKPYRCTAGKLTIGVGRNLEDRGISEREAMMLLKNDVDDIRNDVRLAPILVGLEGNAAREEVIYNMAFNLGVEGLLGFSKMLAAMAAGDFEEAAREMLRSRWAVQVGHRATELAGRMRTGKHD